MGHDIINALWSIQLQSHVAALEQSSLSLSAALMNRYRFGLPLLCVLMSIMLASRALAADIFPTYPDSIVAVTRDTLALSEHSWSVEGRVALLAEFFPNCSMELRYYWNRFLSTDATVTISPFSMRLGTTFYPHPYFYIQGSAGISEVRIEHLDAPGFNGSYVFALRAGVVVRTRSALSFLLGSGVVWSIDPEYCANCGFILRTRDWVPHYRTELRNFPIYIELGINTSW